jgi:hypothetical protein
LLISSAHRTLFLRAVRGVAAVAEIVVPLDAVTVAAALFLLIQHIAIISEDQYASRREYMKMSIAQGSEK